MKVGAVTLAYNDEGTIAGTIKCLKPFVDKHVVLISEVPYFGEPALPDKTEEICRALGVEIVKGEWPLDHMQRNVGNIMSGCCDWILGFDSDEMITQEDGEKLMDFLKNAEAEAYGFHPIVYWHNTDYVLSPKPDYNPIMAMRPDVRFTYIRNIDRVFVRCPITIHHLSWCAPKDIYKKVMHYAHATDFDGAKWYKEKYVSWCEGKVAHLPTGEFETVKAPLPKKLKEYLNVSHT